MKSKIKAGSFAVELSASGTFVLGVLWLGIVWYTTGSIPQPSLNVNFSVPVALTLFGGILGNGKAWFNQVMRF